MVFFSSLDARRAAQCTDHENSGRDLPGLRRGVPWWTSKSTINTRASGRRRSRPSREGCRCIAPPYVVRVVLPRWQARPCFSAGPSRAACRRFLTASVSSIKSDLAHTEANAAPEMLFSMALMYSGSGPFLSLRLTRSRPRL